jgi:pyrimidine-nucleoside phosphorylase
MLHSGDVLDLSDVPGPHIDKHSTGGVGDKISLILAPLAVTAGLRVPMISGRGLGHTGGTLDKLESIPGFQVDQSVQRFKELVRDVGCGLIGQTGEIAPADKDLYALRDVTGTVECIPLIASSIMSKKLAEGIGGLVLDVKIGSGAFMKSVERGRELADAMIQIGEAMETPVSAVLTDMDQPLGLAVGNALEAAEAVDVLRGEGPSDVVDVTIALVTEMMAVGHGSVDREEARAQLQEALADGSALEVFRQIVEAQGGDPAVCDQPREVLPTAEAVVPLEAESSGVIQSMDAEEVGLASLDLGAGRMTKEDEIDPAVGLVFRKKRGDSVEAGEPILDMHVNPGSDVDSCRRRLTDAITIGEEPESPPSLILERRGSGTA